MQRLRVLLLAAVCGLPLCAQQTVNGNRTYLGVVDASSATETKPAKSGTLSQRPSTCNVSDVYFATDATAGSNLSLCTSANTWTAVSGSGAVGGGINVRSSSYTLTASDSGKLFIMNCSAACTATLPSAPASTFYVLIESIGSSVATVSLNGKNFNGSASAPVLNSFREMIVYSDGTNYFGEAPLVAGSNVTLTPASNGVTIASTGGGGSIATGTLAARPSSCSVGALYFATDQPALQQLYQCSGANTWTQDLNVGPSGALAITGGTLDVTSLVPLTGSSEHITGLYDFAPGLVIDSVSSPATPSAGLLIYQNTSDNKLHTKDSGGNDAVLGSGGSSSTVPYAFSRVVSNPTCAASGPVTLDSVTIPANTFQVGDEIQINVHFAGTVDTASSGAPYAAVTFGAAGVWPNIYTGNWIFPNNGSLQLNADLFVTGSSSQVGYALLRSPTQGGLYISPSTDGSGANPNFKAPAESIASPITVNLTFQGCGSGVSATSAAWSLKTFR